MSSSQLRIIAAIASTALLACGTAEPPDSIEACTDMPCRRAWVQDRWSSEPDAVARAIGNLEDPVERMVYVQQLSERHPGQTGDLCKQLPMGKGRDRCLRINARPHLQSSKKKQPSHPERKEKKPLPMTDGSDRLETNFLLMPSGALSSSFTDTPPVLATCPDPALARACQEDAARRLAHQGQGVEAAARCAAVDNAHWREECFFQIAEVLGTVQQLQSLKQAVDMCAAAPSFYPQCLQHLTREARLFAPPQSPGDPASWALFAERLQGAHDQISTLSSTVADRFLSRAWGHGIAHSTRHVTVPTGDLIDAVGEVGAPHVRAVTAQQLWQLEHQTARSLSEWSSRLNEVMAQRGSTPTQAVEGGAHARPDGCNYWQQLLPGEEALSRVTFLGLSQRARSADPDTDQLISLLESASRHPQAASEPLLAEALGHEAPLVRWTAARLMPIFNRDHTGLDAARSDSDALVRGRARHGSLRGCTGLSDSSSAKPRPAASGF